MSLVSFLERVETIPFGACAGQQGRPSISDALLYMPHNDPWEYWLPSTGQLIVRRAPATLHLIKQWWNHDGGRFNTEHPFEQGALWRLEACFRNTTAVIATTTFFKETDQFYCHYASNSPAETRQKGLLNERNKISIDPSKSLAAILSKHVVIEDPTTLLARASQTSSVDGFEACRVNYPFPERARDCQIPAKPANLPSEYTTFD